MAFAISSGVPPQSGIYCAVVAGFLISALGGSKTQIGGPTGAFVVIVSGIVAKHGIESLYICTGMAGIFLVAMGITGFGSAVKFIPRPVVIGFTNGIAVLIASTQIKDFFGATEKIGVIQETMHELPPIIVLRLRNMTAIDATGLKALEDVAHALHKSGRTLILCSAREQPAQLMKQAEFEEHVGAENICPHVEEALKRAKQVYEDSQALKKQFAAMAATARG